MKFLLHTILTLLFLSSVFAGGPDIESNNLKIGQIIVAADEIIMEVDGYFELFTSKTPKDDQNNGNAKFVSLTIRDGILRIPRKKWKHPGGDEYEIYVDWDDYTKDILKWENKEIFTQMWSTETIIRHGQPREIISEHCRISPRKNINETEQGAAANP